MILPNALPPLIVSATLTIGVAILFEAGLSFLGLSDPNVMSWGLMIGFNRDFVIDAWWVVTFSGLVIFVTALSVSLIGDGLNDARSRLVRDTRGLETVVVKDCRNRHGRTRHPGSRWLGNDEEWCRAYRPPYLEGDTPSMTAGFEVPIAST